MDELFCFHHMLEKKWELNEAVHKDKKVSYMGEKYCTTFSLFFYIYEISWANEMCFNKFTVKSV
jgi:hypothetical protein